MESLLASTPFSSLSGESAFFRSSLALGVAGFGSHLLWGWTSQLRRPFQDLEAAGAVDVAEAGMRGFWFGGQASLGV